MELFVIIKTSRAGFLWSRFSLTLIIIRGRKKEACCFLFSSVILGFVCTLLVVQSHNDDASSLINAKKKFKSVKYYPEDKIYKRK